MLLGPIAMPVVRRLGVEAPDLGVSLELSPESRNVDRLEVDAAIRIGESVNESVVEVSLGGLGFGAYAVPELASRWRDEELAAWPVLTFERRWRSFPTMCWLAAHAPATRSRSEFDTMMSMAEATEAGLGIGLLPHAVAVRSGRLVPLRLPALIEPARLTLVYHPDMRSDGRVRALVAAASREARERRNLLVATEVLAAGPQQGNWIPCGPGLRPAACCHLLATRNGCIGSSTSWPNDCSTRTCRRSTPGPRV